MTEIDRNGTNITASAILDKHHEVIGVSGYGDDIFDNCEVCGFAVGWISTGDRDHFGHATACSVNEIKKWIKDQTAGALQ